MTKLEAVIVVAMFAGLCGNSAAGEPTVALPIGVGNSGKPIVAAVDRREFTVAGGQTRVLLIGGLQGSNDSTRSVQAAFDWFHNDEGAAEFRRRFTLSAVAAAIGDRTDAGSAEASFPPKGVAYRDSDHAAAQYLWRWIGMHGPDVVVEVRTGQVDQWLVPRSNDRRLKRLGEELRAVAVPHDAELAAALQATPPAEVGTIPALRCDLKAGDAAGASGTVSTLLKALMKTEFSGPSLARRELQRRVARSPVEVASQLARHYGHDLNQVVYIPAVALIGRLRLGEITNDSSHLQDVERIVAPYFDGKKSAAPQSGSGLSGHLIFSELARRTAGDRRQRYLELALASAELAFDEDGRPRPSMPYHSEMSDAVFMGGPILAEVGGLTGQRKYFDACVRHVRFMQRLVLRPDGLYRHSPLDEAAWGRGNGFPALGLALCLAEFPADHPDRAEMLAAFQKHMDVLARHQDPTGCWHQIIDRPDSYRELSCTCMITFAMARGVGRGWLDEAAFRPVIDRAWTAIKSRIAADGRLVDVCTGTGKQKSLADYYQRPAILGRDARGGAMALLVATELAATELATEK